ncbi:MAG: phosphatidate cytidylyltransferase [Betaproteobacteria bacterium]
MFKTRVVTAVLLLLVFFFALFELPPLGWAIFSTLVVAIAAWEWGGLMRLASLSRYLLAMVFVLVCALVAYLEPSALNLKSGFFEAAWRTAQWFYIPAALFWLLGVPLWLKYRWPLPKSWLGGLLGMLLLLPAWLALIQLKQFGAFGLIAVMATVWLADIAAYFFGHAFGRHKLAPNISPGKTWEGACGGVLAVVIYGFILAPNLPEALSSKPVVLLLALIFVSVLSILGDLFESLLKRQAGLKDSSNVLPGHGGVLDRIDSLTSTLPLVALIWFKALN